MFSSLFRRFAAAWVAVAWLLAALLAAFLFAAPVQAQVFDDVDVRKERDDAVVQIKFTVAIQFLRAVPAKSGDLVQAFYEIRPGGELPRFFSGERRLAGGGALPAITITDEAVRSDFERKLVIRFDKPTKFRVRPGAGNRSIEIVIAGAASAVDALRAAPPRAAEERFVITLQRSTDPNLRMDVPVPGELQAYQLFTARRVVEGKTIYEINLGYFATREEAERAQRILQRRFPAATVVDLRPLAPPTAVAAVREAPAPTPAPPAAPADIDQRGKELLAQGRAAFEKKDYESAIAALNQLLNLPPNLSSQEGQELIGVTRARLADVARARAEFELYLKLYPTGPGADRVRAELAALSAAPAKEAVRARPRGEPVTSWAGSFSQYYYGGRSTVTTLLKDTPLEGAPQVISEETISDVDQSQLATNIDLNWRRRGPDSDMRFVLRNTYTHDFLSRSQTFSTRHPNRLSALYFDYKSLGTGLSARLGRQSPTGGGVLSRFDGAKVGYAFVPKFSVNAVGGVPAESLFETKRHFYGLSLDAENIGDRVSASLYGIQQMIDGEVDRRAVGTELRYFDPTTSVFSVVDYDTLYRAVNIASLQGTWTTLANTTTFNLLVDRRTVPLLSTGNALIAANANALTPGAFPTQTDLLATQSIEATRALAKATTAYAKQGVLGVTFQATQNLQFGADARLTNIGALPAFGNIPAQPSTGNIYGYGLQSIATNLYSERDAHVLNFTYLTGPTFTGRLYSYSNLSLLWQKLQLEPSLRFYTQTDTTGVQLDRLTPELRMTYRFAPSFSIESDVSVERSETVSATQSDTATRTFFFVGYRYDY